MGGEKEARGAGGTPSQGAIQRTRKTSASRSWKEAADDKLNLSVKPNVAVLRQYMPIKKIIIINFSLYWPVQYQLLTAAFITIDSSPIHASFKSINCLQTGRNWRNRLKVERFDANLLHNCRYVLFITDASSPADHWSFSMGTGRQIWRHPGELVNGWYLLRIRTAGAHRNQTGGTDTS